MIDFLSPAIPLGPLFIQCDSPALEFVLDQTQLSFFADNLLVLLIEYGLLAPEFFKLFIELILSYF
jgi:hypothetical protein